MVERVTRRRILAVLPGLAAARSFPAEKSPSSSARAAGEFVRLIDPATEAVVVRLTNPATTSVLPAPGNRFISSKRRFLIFSSDRTGRPAPFQLDLRTGRLRQLAETANLVPRSLCMDDKERFVYFIDKSSLREVSLSGLKARTIAEDVTAFSPPKSASEFIFVRHGRLERLGEASAVLADDVGDSSLPYARPDGNGCFFERELSQDERQFWYVPFSAADRKPILLAQGCISNPFWSPDSSSLLFLRFSDKQPNSSEVHEVIPETALERRVAATTQFAAFAPNGDASVFVGAIRSKAQPNIALLLRSVQRELTLCEHGSRQPASVSPVFSPDSRRVYFQSDHQGKSALYSVNVELLVEPTVAPAQAG